MVRAGPLLTAVASFSFSALISSAFPLLALQRSTLCNSARSDLGTMLLPDSPQSILVYMCLPYCIGHPCFLLSAFIPCTHTVFLRDSARSNLGAGRAAASQPRRHSHPPYLPVRILLTCLFVSILPAYSYPPYLPIRIHLASLQSSDQLLTPAALSLCHAA